MDIVKGGLQIWLDAGFDGSYNINSTTSWNSLYRGTSASTNSTLINSPTYSTAYGGIISFDGTNESATGSVPSVLTTGIATIEMFAKFGTVSTTKMPFIWNTYNVCVTSTSLGFNTFNSDVYGLNFPAQGNSWDIMNNWTHYIFEMRNGVSYTNNNIYINGITMSLSQISGTENTTNRNFNNGNFRIASDSGSTYSMPMQIQTLRIYNRQLTKEEISQNYSLTKKRFEQYKSNSTNIDRRSLVMYIDPGNKSCYSPGDNHIYNLVNYSGGSTGSNVKGFFSASYSTNFSGVFQFNGNNYIGLTRDPYRQNNLRSSESYITGGVSLSAWFKTGATYGVIYGQTDNSSPNAGGNWTPMMYVTNGGKLRCTSFYGSNGNLDYITSTTTISNNYWNHAVLTYITTSAGSGTQKLYINGVEEASASITTQTFYDPFYYWIGVNKQDFWYDIGTSSYFNGLIGEIAYWEKPMSSSEVLKLYTNSKPKYDVVDLGLMVNLISYDKKSYPGSGTAWTNIANYGVPNEEKTAYLLGGATPSGSGILFDGTSDYAKLGTSSFLAFTGSTPFTICCYFKLDAGLSADSILMGKWDFNTAWGYYFYINGSEQAFFDIDQLSIASVGTYQLSIGSKYYICGVYDGQYINLYGNGTRQGGSASSTGISPFTNYYQTPFTIGGDSGEITFSPVTIYNVHVYNRALSAEEILSNYNNLKATNP